MKHPLHYNNDPCVSFLWSNNERFRNKHSHN
jgi:hypothetical protein